MSLFCNHDWKMEIGHEKINNEPFVRFLTCKKCGKSTWNKRLILKKIAEHNSQVDLAKLKEGEGK